MTTRESGAAAYNKVVDRTLAKPPYSQACALLKERQDSLTRGGAYQVLAVLMVHSGPMKVREIGEAAMGREFGQLAPKNWASRRLDIVGDYADYTEEPGGYSWTLKPSFRDRFPEVVPSLHRPDLFRPADTMESEPPNAVPPDVPDDAEALPAAATDDGPPAVEATVAEVAAAGTTSFFGVIVRDRDIRRAIDIRKEGIRDAAGTAGAASLVKYGVASGSGRWQAAVHRKAFEDAQRGAITPEQAGELDRFDAEAERDDLITALDADRSPREHDHLRLDQAPPHLTSTGTGPSSGDAARTTAEETPVPAEMPRDTARPAAPSVRDVEEGPQPGKRPARMRNRQLPEMAGRPTDQAAATAPSPQEEENAMATDKAEQDIDLGKLGFSPGPAMFGDGQARAGSIVGSLDAMVKPRQRELLAKLVKFIIGTDKLQAYLDQGITEEEIAKAFTENGVDYLPV